MPRDTFLHQEFIAGVISIFALTVAFNRWFPEANIIAVDAHPSSYLKTFSSVSEYTQKLYGAYLLIDIVRIFALATLESAAFSFAFQDDKFEPLSFMFFGFTLVSLTKDIMMLGCLYAFPESNDRAAEKAAELFPLSVNVENGLLAVGALSLAWGLYQWTNNIGRDKRQVIDEKKTQ